MPAPSRPPSLARLDEIVKRHVTDLFLSYERASVGGFRAFIAGDFRGRDDLGLGHSAGQFGLSVEGDFRNLRDVNFDVLVNPPEYSADFKQARVDVRWNRRARFATTGEEWIVRNQVSTLMLDLGHRQTRLAAIDGNAVFGLTNAMGVLVVDRGTVDGQTVSGVQSVLNGRLGAGTQDVFTFGNQRRNQTAGDPDLSIAGISVSPDPPSVSAGRYTVTVTVHNGGPVNCPASQLQVSATGSSTQLQTVPGLAPGGSSTVTLSGFTAPGPPATLIVITATADPFNVIRESNKANNTAILRKVDVP